MRKAKGKGMRKAKGERNEESKGEKVMRKAKGRK